VADAIARAADKVTAGSICIALAKVLFAEGAHRHEENNR
jgi:hypothetical protein